MQRDGQRSRKRLAAKAGGLFRGLRVGESSPLKRRLQGRNPLFRTVDTIIVRQMYEETAYTPRIERVTVGMEH